MGRPGPGHYHRRGARRHYVSRAPVHGPSGPWPGRGRRTRTDGGGGRSAKREEKPAGKPTPHESRHEAPTATPTKAPRNPSDGNGGRTFVHPPNGNDDTLRPAAPPAQKQTRTRKRGGGGAVIRTSKVPCHPGNVEECDGWSPRRGGGRDPPYPNARRAAVGNGVAPRSTTTRVESRR